MNREAHILIIEDDPAVARGLQDGLEREGYTVTWKGSGLGLAIIKAIVTAHGGEVAVASAGGGARFTVTLPVAEVTSMRAPTG